MGLDPGDAGRRARPHRSTRVRVPRCRSRSPRYLEVLAKLKRTFEIVHLHFNNYSCTARGAPFPAWAYEVTLVNKRLAEVDPAGR